MKIPETMQEEVATVRAKILSLVREKAELAHQLEMNRAEIRHHLTLLDQMAYDVIVKTGHDARDYILNGDNLEIETRSNAKR